MVLSFDYLLCHGFWKQFIDKKATAVLFLCFIVCTSSCMCRCVGWYTCMYVELYVQHLLLLWSTLFWKTRSSTEPGAHWLSRLARHQGILLPLSLQLWHRWHTLPRWHLGGGCRNLNPGCLACTAILYWLSRLPSPTLLFVKACRPSIYINHSVLRMVT